ncbi:hypothetical protein V6N13_001841 [Hibiscus sabdariffa]
MKGSFCNVDGYEGNNVSDSGNSADGNKKEDENDDYSSRTDVLATYHTTDKRIEELDSSKFFLEPVDPSIEEGLMENILDYSIGYSLSAPLEDSDNIDLL